VQSNKQPPMNNVNYISSAAAKNLTNAPRFFGETWFYDNANLVIQLMKFNEYNLKIDEFIVRQAQTNTTNLTMPDV
jgi:hypothetical protein